MFEKHLIVHCAPTLASLKAASLFCLAIESEQELAYQIFLWNRQLREKGLFMTVLQKRTDRALIYVFRKSHLQEVLHRTGVRAFLLQYGYPDIEVESALKQLKIRLGTSESFPHEIGLFLGYPLGDVIGFIQNAGKNCKYAGYWKVYCNENETKKLFCQFRKCQEIYVRLWNQGKTVRQLAVAA